MTPVPLKSPPPPAPVDPVLATLERIERRIAEVERVTSALAPLVDAAPGGVAAVADVLDSLAGRLMDRGVDLDARLRAVIRAVEAATSPRAVAALSALVESRLLDPGTLAMLDRVAEALATPSEARPVGAWGLLKALRDPDVQRALGLLLGVAREIGHHLPRELDGAPRRQLTATTEEEP